MKESSKNNTPAPKGSAPKHTAPKPAAPSQDGVISIELQHLLTPLAILFSGFMISIVLFFGLRDLTVDTSDTKSDTGTTTTTTTGDTAAADPNTFADATTTIDDDPYKGDKDKAEFAIVEFTDFQCPFCQRAFQETYPDLIKNYVDTGKAIYVLRDYPLSFHPIAQPAAVGANCAIEQGGKDKFFDYHDKLFSITLSSEDQITQAASDIGLDMGKFNDCLDSGKYDDEVQNDLDDGTAAGVSGTPGFVVGKLDKDGNVTGKLIGGAYPLSSFEKVFSEL